MIEILSARCGCLIIPEYIIRPGLVAIAGPNGSGKTTLLELIAGIRTLSQGSILVHGRDPEKIPVGWVGEFPDLNLVFTRVVDEIASPLRFSFQSSEAIDQSVRDLSEMVGLTPLLDRPVRNLSGGEKVLTALAAALINRPEILILDETDSHLDAMTLRSVDLVIRRAEVPLVLFATHRPDRIASADRVMVMKEGEDCA